MGAEGLIDLLLYYTHRYTHTHMMHTKIHSYSGPNPPNCAAIVLTDTYYIDIYICVRVRPSVCLYTAKHNAAVKFMVTPR